MSVWHRAFATTFTRTSPALGGCTMMFSILRGFFCSQAARARDAARAKRVRARAVRRSTRPPPSPLQSPASPLSPVTRRQQPVPRAIRCTASLAAQRAGLLCSGEGIQRAEAARAGGRASGEPARSSHAPTAALQVMGFPAVSAMASLGEEGGGGGGGGVGQERAVESNRGE